MPLTPRDITLLILVDKDGKLLLQHRTHDAPVNPDHWGFFGGGLENDEKPEKAIQREIQEEIGYTLKNPRLVLTERYEGTKHYGTKYVFLEKYDHQQKIVLNEGQEFGWFQLSELSGLKLSPHIPVILDSVKDQVLGI